MKIICAAEVHSRQIYELICKLENQEMDEVWSYSTGRGRRDRVTLAIKPHKIDRKNDATTIDGGRVGRTFGARAGRKATWITQRTPPIVIPLSQEYSRPVQRNKRSNKTAPEKLAARSPVAPIASVRPEKGVPGGITSLAV